ncbi:uncharacterized protein LOC125645645 isoform X2 [Ostrea edulis]|uniref:uncharacterized protein LOC125645645 isoform X2 n=1 Tax=Ostrea edulis TaxID=37623 RepID=UPI0024AFB046|nr:uncharacterized protein LOC125645645 isoform X2 [Ostrea edulis]
MDGTFKVVPDFLKPRGHLLSIHGFVRRDGQEQQFLLVFQGILSALPTPPSVEMFMVDFEQRAWKSIHSTFPDATIKGCCFHWSQALWRRFQDLGLAPTYKKRGATLQYLKQLMALPFLPHQDIGPAFQTLTCRTSTEVIGRIYG